MSGCISQVFDMVCDPKDRLSSDECHALILCLIDIVSEYKNVCEVYSEKAVNLV